jgi:Mn-dependent DtxR family transcriptional regulator
VRFISNNSENTAPKTGLERIIDYFNAPLKVNKPVGIQDIEENTGLSWTYVKRMLNKLKKQEYVGFHFEKVGNSWVAWKDREHIIKKMDDTCGRFLSSEGGEEMDENEEEEC